MSKYESGIKQIPCMQTKVYETLSNLNNVGKIKDMLQANMANIPNADEMKQKLPVDQIKDLAFDADSVSVNVSPVGNVTLRIIEREEPKCIKLEADNSPVPVTLWIQLLPVTAYTCKMRLTVKADIPIFLKPMVGGKLKDGIDKIADMLAMLPYNVL